MMRQTTPAPTVTRFVMRQAIKADMDHLMEFYGANASEALPAPSIQALVDAMNENSRIILIERPEGDEILASSAIFDFTPRGCAGHVGELSGTKVTRRLNGFGPVGVQRLLLGARLLSHVAYNDAQQGNTTSLISIVRSDNRKSLANVAAAGLVRLDQRPKWFSYEELSWNGAAVAGEWTYFLATDDTVRQAIAQMIDVGLFSGTVRLERRDRETGLPDVADIEVRLPGLFLAEGQLRAILDGVRPGGLSPPPERLVLI